MSKKIIRIILMCLFVLSINSVMAQNSITGAVTDDSGSPLPGASVVVKGTTKGVITDFNGKFSISVPANARLIISFVGMNNIEVGVGTSKTINVQLTTSAIGVEEVVVTALGMKKEKKALGYSVSQVNSDQIATGGATNALKSLEGKITGVQMNSLTASPTSSVMFNIRGATSLAGIMKGSGGNINNETQPLIVLDGVPVSSNRVSTTAGIDVGNYMSSINPNDIESISILKGASAAALYGSSAGNGVILITTKNGSKAKKGIGVSINSSTSFNNAYSAPPVQRTFFQGSEDGSPMTEDKAGMGWNINDDVNNVPVPRWNLLTQKWETSKLEARGDQSPLLAFLKTGYTLDYNVNVTGNYEKGNYRLTVGSLNDLSVVPSNQTKRYDVGFNAAYKLNEKVTFSSQASFSRTFVPNQSHIYGKREDNPLAHAMSMPINMPPMSVWKQADTWLTDWNGTYQNTPYLNNPNEPRLSRVNATGFDNAIGKNGPYFAAQNIIRTYAKNNFFGKVQMDWKIIDPLTFTLRSGLNSETFAFERKTPWGSERATKGAYEQQQSNNIGISSDAILAYNNYFFDKKLSIDGLVGLAFAFGESNSSGFGGNELTTPNSFNFSSLPATIKQNSSYFNKGYSSRSYGAYVTATLGWQSMLYLDLSGRNDWVGILDHEKDHHFYPGASLSWIATQSFDMPDWINLLKLRGGYATTGYGIGRPVNKDAYGIGATWNGVPTGTIGGALVDANINPELNITKEVGLDFGFAENRILGELTAYSKDHINQIQNLPVVGSSGFGSMLTNMGSVESTGIEASLTVVPVRNKDWNWSITVNATTFKSVIKDLDSRFAEKFYGYEGSAYLSLFKGTKVGDLYAQKPIPRIETGKYKGMMITGFEGGPLDMTVTSTDYLRKNAYLGNMNPDAILGFSTAVKYKNWNLGIVTSLRVGGVFISETAKIMVDDGMGDIGKIFKDNYNEYWTGGRFAGGLASMPNPDDIFPASGWDVAREVTQERMSYYNGDKRYMGYWNAVFIDPNKNISGKTPEQLLSLPDDYYIKNGADPKYTFYGNSYLLEGDALWSGAQFRTWDATVFKIKEINLTYTLNKSVAAKIHCQDVTITAFAKNVMFWANNPMNEDPENAFRDGISGMGISQFGLPPVRMMGLKLGLNF